MRVAIFSDVHGNSRALDAVLADIDHHAVDAYWFGGDAAALGFDPAGSVQRLAALPNLSSVRGNSDRYTLVDTDEDNRAFIRKAGEDPEGALVSMAYGLGFAWTRGAVTATGYDRWMADLPVEQRFTLPDGTRVLLVHAAPGTDDGSGIQTRHTDDEVAAMVENAVADLVIVGHTHVPLDRTVANVRVWNLGSVSNPKTDDTRAMWTLLDANESGYTLERHYAEYDIAAMLEQLEAANYPTAAAVRANWP